MTSGHLIRCPEWQLQTLAAWTSWEADIVVLYCVDCCKPEKRSNIHAHTPLGSEYGGVLVEHLLSPQTTRICTLWGNHVITPTRSEITRHEHSHQSKTRREITWKRNHVCMAECELMPWDMIARSNRTPNTRMESANRHADLCDMRMLTHAVGKARRAHCPSPVHPASRRRLTGSISRSLSS